MSRARLHISEDQLDGHAYAYCGRVQPNNANILSTGEFEAAYPSDRCKICERWWFPNGQPEWHREAAMSALILRRAEDMQSLRNS